jgi:transcriptional regulator with XRE-family HTH domain
MQKKIFDWKWRIYKAGITQKAFCKRFNIHESQLSDWIRGRKPPKKRSVEKIEGYLKELGV